MYEAASALNQIIHREGPAELAVGDVDTYVEKWLGDTTALRLLEHKQPSQALGRAQEKVLAHLNQAIRHAVECPDSGLNLHAESGVYVVRGDLEPEAEGRRKVDFASRQIVTRLDGEYVFEPNRRVELWDWLNCGPGVDVARRRRPANRRSGQTFGALPPPIGCAAVSAGKPLSIHR